MEGGVPDAVADGSSGSLVPFGDHAGFAAVTLHWLDVRGRLGYRGLLSEVRGTVRLGSIGPKAVSVCPTDEMEPHLLAVFV